MECITVAALGMLPRARAGERREGQGRSREVKGGSAKTTTVDGSPSGIGCLPQPCVAD
jgi:hypothetical protein